jgi:hypothetical protein
VRAAHAARGAVTRAELARLVREYLLCGHLIDRAGMPLLVGPHGRDAMRDVAIEEWRGASPVYTRRTQQLLGFGNGDVETVFKGMQVDIGAPPQFMDFRYRVRDEGHGEFWLDHCGALMDVEPMGEGFVVAMCHDIEDPTFDATAWATDPRARMTPIHRPPRHPADRHPHCHWNVVIDPEAEALPEPEEARRMAGTRLAQLPVATIDPTDEGRCDYAGPLEADVRFEAFSASALRALLDEVAIQHQLLALSFADAVGRRWGPEAARDIGVRQLTGIAGLTAERLASTLGVAGGGLDAVARVLDLHPALRPRSYVDLRVTRDGGRLSLALGDCPALHEDVAASWPMLLTGAGEGPMQAMAQAVDPVARCSPVGERSWEVVLDPAAPAPKEPPEVTRTRFSSGAAFEFADR